MSAADNKKLVQQIFADSAARSGTTFADNLAEDAKLGRDRAIFMVARVQGRGCDPERPDGPFPLVLRRAAEDAGVQLHRRRRLCRGRSAAATT